jgi:hypothetical protein
VLRAARGEAKGDMAFGRVIDDGQKLPPMLRKGLRRR